MKSEFLIKEKQLNDTEDKSELTGLFAPERAFLNKQQIADWFGVSKRTLERWVETDEFPSPFRIGGVCFWHVPTLTRWGVKRFLDENAELRDTMHATLDEEQMVTGDRSETCSDKDDRRQKVSRRTVGVKDFSPVMVTRRPGAVPISLN